MLFVFYALETKGIHCFRKITPIDDIGEAGARFVTGPGSMAVTRWIGCMGALVKAFANAFACGISPVAIFTLTWGFFAASGNGETGKREDGRNQSNLQ